MEQQLYELLRQCTVRISVSGKIGHGTGFFVAPGLVLTCAHVVKAAQSSMNAVEVYRNGQSYIAQIMKLQQEHDLALLQVSLTDHSCVYLHEEAIPFDVLYSYGYPDDHPDGDPVTFSLEGIAGKQGEQLKFKSGQVRPGLSGAPLLNVRRRHVCGIVQLTRDRHNDLGGRAIPTTIVFRVFPEIITLQQQFHQQNKRWMNCLEDIATKQLADRPRNYIPFPRNSLFQPRSGEFEQLEYLLLEAEKKQQSTYIGLVGMGGIGKTQLAVELSYRYRDRHRFPAGIFWMTATGNNLFDWQSQFTELAFKTGYLPPGDDPSSSENERRRATHFCRYLADHSDILLILDNVEDPSLVLSVLPVLAGGNVACSILYTSRNKFIPEGVIAHSVEQLSEEGALHLLLNGHRSSLLSQVVADSSDEESCAAREICRGVGCMPLALVHLRGWLVRDLRVTLRRLKEVLAQRGALELGKKQYGDAVPLFATFRLSWEKIASDEARRLFKLASYFPEAVPIQLWLLGLVAGLGEQGDIFEPLGQAYVQLQELSLLEGLSENQVRLHPLVRAFGQQLVAEEGDMGKKVLAEAGERLATPFIDLNKLEQRALQEGYWECLRQIQSARAYAALIRANQETSLAQVERWLDRESYLLADQKWWPHVLPGLFYQQLFNRAVEEGSTFFVGKEPAFWLRQINQVGAEDSSQVRVFAGHTDRVTSVAFSPNGKQILTGSNDQTARLWDTTNGQVLLTLEKHTAKVNSVAFSPDGKLLLTGASDGVAIVWNAANGQILRRLEGHRDMVMNIDHTSDGTIIVSDPVTHQVLIELEGHIHAEVQLESSSNGTVLLRNRVNGQVLAELPKCTSKVTSVVFSPDGSKILTGATDQTARLWDTASGQVLQVLEGHMDSVNSVAFSPDGSKVLTGSADRMAWLWDMASGQVQLELKGHTAWGVDSVAFSPDGSKVLTGSWDGTARLWDATSGQLLLTLEDHSTWERGIDCVAFSPDSKKALTGSIDGTAKLWDLASEKLLMTFTGHTNSYVRSIAFSPDGRYALSGSDDETARLWSIVSEQIGMISEDQTSAIESLDFSPDGKKVLTGSWDGIGRVLDTATGQVLTTLEGHTNFILGVAFSPDGRRALTSSFDGTTRIWDTISGQSLHILESNGLVGVFSPDGTKVLTIADDPTPCRICIWDTTSWQMLITLESDKLSVVSAAFSPDGQRVLTGSTDGVVQMWDVTNGQLYMNLEGHTDQIDSVSFSPNGQWVLTGSSDGTVRLWDATSGQLLLILESGYGGASFSPDGRWILTLDGPGRVFFWQIIKSDKARPFGLFVAAHSIGDLHWTNANSVILADTGGSRCHPHFYYLKLEGT